MGRPSPQSEEGIAQPVEVTQGDFALGNQSIERYGPSLGPPANGAGQMASRDSRGSPGKHKMAEGWEFRFKGIDPTLHAIDSSSFNRGLALSGPIGISEHAADAEKMVLNIENGIPLRSQDFVVQQTTDDGIQLIERAVSFNPGVVLVDT
jgi:hypothetical protein